jgi:hypothetical protein
MVLWEGMLLLLAAAWCSGSGKVGRGCPLPTRARWMSLPLGCVCVRALASSSRPAKSAIRTTNRKCQVGTPYSAWTSKPLSRPRCCCQSLCFAAILVGASPPSSCVLPLRSYSVPWFPLCVSEYHDYFMLSILFLEKSLW